MIANWLFFAKHFGFANLVPVALASERTESTLPEGVIGKVPSVYNSRGEIVGFKNWQRCRATELDIERWSRDPRYGCGVILGQPLPNMGGAVAVCIDVDTENYGYQMVIANLIRDALAKRKIPMRVRSNSHRRAYVLAVRPRDGEQITKRILRIGKTPEGKPEAVEILGYGQQFVVFGRHPSGVDIEWLDGTADDVRSDVLLPNPAELALSWEAFDALVNSIAAELPVEVDTQTAARRMRTGAANDVKPDAVAVYLDEHGYTLSIGCEGERHIRSPFAAEYTQEQGDNDTSVTYFLPGTHNYEQGHFVSLHASDAHRTDIDFLDAIGFVAAQFDSYPAEPDSKPIAPPFERDRVGAILPTLPNLLSALRAPEWLGYDIRFDSFAGEIVVSHAGTRDSWRPLRDTDYTWLRVAVETRGFRSIGRDMIRDAVAAVAEMRAIDTARTWLTGLSWDGVSRCERFFIDYFGVEDSPYARAVGLYAWTAQAGRVLSPGCKADMMPILIGDQGCGKSTGVEAIAPSPETFAVLSFNDNEADAARKIKGVLVGEFGEMNGLKSRAIEAIKQHTTQTHDKWVAKYKEQATIQARRCVFYGTSNDHELLDDVTGARRWLPMECGKVKVEAIKADCAQLWAEAREIYKERGVVYARAQLLALEIHDNFRVVDELESRLSDWLETPDDLDGSAPAERGSVTTADAIDAMKARGVRIELDRSGQIRIGKALAALGYKRRRKFFNNRLRYVYENSSVT